MAAETGSGKTGAFSLPVIQCVYETKTGGQCFSYRVYYYYKLFQLLANMPP